MTYDEIMRNPQCGDCLYFMWESECSESHEGDACRPACKKFVVFDDLIDE